MFCNSTPQTLIYFFNQINFFYNQSIICSVDISIFLLNDIIIIYRVSANLKNDNILTIVFIKVYFVTCEKAEIHI